MTIEYNENEDNPNIKICKCGLFIEDIETFCTNCLIDLQNNEDID